MGASVITDFSGAKMRGAPARSLSLVVAVVTLPLLTMPTWSAAASDPAPVAPAACPRGSMLAFEELQSKPLPAACTNITTIVDGNLSVEIPAAGTGIAVSAQYPSDAEGNSPGFMVFSDPATKQIVATPREARPEQQVESARASANMRANLSTDDGCTDTANTPYIYKLIASEPWYFDPSGAPANLGSTASKNAVQSGFGFVASGYNDCGLTYNFSSVLAPSYVAGTNIGTGISASGTCTNTPDSYSVVSFDSAPSAPDLALGCTIVNSNQQVITSDIRFNTRWAWTNTLTSCNSQYEIQGTAAHEWGHAAGMNHVLEATSPWQTMSENKNGLCQGSERTLGRGDLIGLDAKY